MKDIYTKKPHAYIKFREVPHYDWVETIEDPYIELEWEKYNDFIRVYKSGKIERHPMIKTGLGRAKGIDITVDYSQWVEPKYNYNTYGYKQFTWHEKTMYVHVMVAQAWLPNDRIDPDGRQIGIDECMEVDHIDGNRSNNNIGNLRWVSRKWNNQHKDCYGRKRTYKKK